MTWRGVLAGGAGKDTLNLSAISADVTASLADRFVTYAVKGSTFTGQIGQFENLVSGAGNDWLTGDDFANSLSSGSGSDTIDAGGGDDILAGDDGDDWLNGQAGNDVVTGAGGNDMLRGGGGNDVLDGGNADDTIFGQDGSDTLLMSSGDDLLDGGMGPDLLDLSQSTISQAVNLTETSIDGFAGDLRSVDGTEQDTFFNLDSIVGSNQVDTLTGLTADAMWDVSGRLYTEIATGRRLTWNSFEALTGGAERDSFANVRTLAAITLSGGAGADLIDASAMTVAITLLGGDGNDELHGGSGTDNLCGENGDDTLIGGGGNDSLLGQAGNDLLDDVVGMNILNGGADNDSLRFVGTWTLTTTGAPLLPLVSEVETIFGGGIADLLVGSSLADRFTVSANGTVRVNSTALSFSGFEKVSGGSGALSDSVSGGAEDDMCLLGALGTLLFNGVSMQGFEIVSGGGGNDRLRGSDTVAETFTAGLTGVTVSQWTTKFDSFESLAGGDGLKIDTFNGTTGSDLFQIGAPGVVTLRGIGLQGFEIVSGGAGSDRLQGTDTAAETFIALSAGVNVLGWDGVTFKSIELLDAGAADFIDTLTGGAGIDTFTVDPLGTLKVNGIFASGFEVVTGGAGNDKLIGSNALPDLFQATSAGIQVSGLNGVTFRDIETLSGGGGNDTLQVFDDALFGTLFDGGTGTDCVDLSNSSTNRSVTLTSSLATGFGARENASGASFVSIDAVKGSNGNDTLTGLGVMSAWDVAGKQYKNVSASRVLTWDSFESLSGGLNKDSFTNVTGTSSMTLNGGAGDDLLDASAATASVLLLGGDGNDVLKGGHSADVLDGGAGADSLDGGDGDDILLGGFGNDTLRGGAGNDRLAGSLGQDLLQGQDGDDTLVGGSSADHLDGGLGNDVLAARTGSATVEADTVSTANSDDLLILTAYALQSEYDFGGQTLRPFEWLGSQYEGS